MTTPIVNTVVGVVLVSLVLIIGVIVFGTFEAGIDHSDLTAEASQAVNDTADQTYSGFSLGSLIPYVLFAVAIIVVLLRAFSF